MAEQSKPTCSSPGPEGMRCFLLKGHTGKHRGGKIQEWIGECHKPDCRWKRDNTCSCFDEVPNANRTTKAEAQKIAEDKYSMQTPREQKLARDYIELLSELELCQSKLNRAIQALKFADTPEAVMVSFAELVEQLEAKS